MPYSFQPVQAAVNRLKFQLKTVPKVVANEALNFTLDRFKSGSWVAPWPKRKAKTAWGTTPRNNGRAILIDKGRLRRGNRVVRADWNAIVLGNDVPYARVHNDGFKGTITQNVKPFVRKYSGRDRYGVEAGKTLKNSSRIKYVKTVSGISHVKEHTRKIKMNMPRRRFMGDHPLLQRRLRFALSMHLSK